MTNFKKAEKHNETLYFVKLPHVHPLDAYMAVSCAPGTIGYKVEYSSKTINEVGFCCEYDEKYYGGWQRQFTEKEIKAIDEKYWVFAVPVDMTETV